VFGPVERGTSEVLLTVASRRRSAITIAITVPH
jgi:hypothetical protein